MLTVLFFVFLYLFYKAARAAIRAVRTAGTRERGQPERADPLAGKLASLEYLQEQRDILTDLLENTEFQLSMCPPEKQREKLLKDKARIYGQLATVESKISKLIG